MRHTLPNVITAGFATSVAMWFVAYIVHLPGLTAPAPVTAALLGLVQICGCALGARRHARPRSLLVGAGTGLVSSVVNLLILGALVASPDTDAATPGAALVTLGSVGAGVVLGALAGAVVGTRAHDGDLGAGPRPATDWRARFAIVACAGVLPVLLSGGIVTSTETGMAVPDWPTSFGANMFLLPIGRMTGGVLFEHAHRLFGSLAGLCVVVLASWVAVTERNALINVAALLVLGATSILSFVLEGTLHNVVPLVGILVGVGATFALSGWRAGAATVALALVIIQGVLGGIRVLADSSVLAFVHGISGQLTFAYLCALAALLSPAWSRATRGGSPDRLVRTGASILLVLVVVQLVLGAGTRHFEQHPAFMHPHILGAILIVIVGTMVGFRARSHHRDVPALKRSGGAVAHVTYTQFALGMATIAFVLLNRDKPQSPPVEVIIATAHQALGALLFGLVTLLWLWSRRLLPTTKAGAAPATPAS